MLKECEWGKCDCYGCYCTLIIAIPHILKKTLSMILLYTWGRMRMREVNKIIVEIILTVKISEEADLGEYLIEMTI